MKNSVLLRAAVMALWHESQIRREDHMARKAKTKRSSRRSGAKTTAKPASAAAPSVPRKHGRFDYSPIIDRPVLRWPNGARVAVWVIPNIEHFYFDKAATRIPGAITLTPDVMGYSW